MTDSSSVARLLILVAVGLQLGRLASAERLFEPSVPSPAKWPAERPKPMPTFGSNDRSRWATVVSLVERGTFVVGQRDVPATQFGAVAMLASAAPLEAATLYATGRDVRVKTDAGLIFADGWQSVDKVLHPSTLEYYSTKPPLLTVLMAGAYYPLHHGLGLSLEREPFLLVRVLVGLFNLLPLPLYLWLVYRVAERYSGHAWTPFFLLAAASFGSLMTPFLITFSNHVPAVYAVLFLMVVLLRIERTGAAASYGWYVLAGLLAGFAATNELPALSLAGLAFLILLRGAPTKALVGYLPAMLLPLGALYTLNYVAWGQFVPVYSEIGGMWYQYEGSHWLQIPGAPRRGIDFARFTESRGEYAFHLLLGHHGFFSLTPIFLLSLVGLGLLCAQQAPTPSAGKAALPWWLAPTVVLLSVVVIGFYLVKSDNYGGWTNGPRWLLWLGPLWLLAAIPALDRLATSRAGRAVALMLLFASVFSASYFPWSPWRHPWIFNVMDSAGAIPY